MLGCAGNLLAVLIIQLALDTAQLVPGSFRGSLSWTGRDRGLITTLLHPFCNDPGTAENGSLGLLALFHIHRATLHIRKQRCGSADNIDALPVE